MVKAKAPTGLLLSATVIAAALHMVLGGAHFTIGNVVLTWNEAFDGLGAAAVIGAIGAVYFGRRRTDAATQVEMERLHQQQSTNQAGK